MKILCAILSIAILACNNNNKKPSPVGTSIGNHPPKDTTINDSTINIAFAAGKTMATVEGSIKGFGHPVTVNVAVNGGQKLIAKIVPADSLANIRFNQVFTPDGKADGPFGRELEFDIKQIGTYKLIISEDLMQGDEWKGKFTLTVSIPTAKAGSQVQ